MKLKSTFRLILILFILLISTMTFMMLNPSFYQKESSSFIVYPIGKVEKKGNRTFIVINKKYEAGLKGLENFSEMTVIYWFDRNDTPEKRAILQVHPRGNPENPIRGVFATHSPVRPNLIAISRCNILSVKNNIIEIDQIDAFDDTPVLDLKN